MAAPDREIIEVRLHGARADVAAIALAPGVQTQPFSVGANGQWRVQGDGIGPVHLFLGFDGQLVHAVAVSPQLPVLFAGRPLGGAWASSPVPCEIRFGVATLVIRRATSLAPSAEEAAPRTESDGGALWQAAQRAAQAGRPPPPANPGAAPPAGGPGQTMWLGQRPSADLPDAPTGAAQSDMRVTPPANVPPPTGGLTPSLSLDVQKKSFWASASPVKKITLVLLPVAIALSVLSLRDPPQTPGMTRSVPASSSARTAASEGRPNTFAAANPPRAAFSDSASGAAPVPTPVPTAPPVRAPTPFEVPPLDTSPKGPFAASKPAARTPEREALDAVARGSLDDAVRDYEALATAHADEPAFKEAARILRAKAGHLH